MLGGIIGIALGAYGIIAGKKQMNGQLMAGGIFLVGYGVFSIVKALMQTPQKQKSDEASTVEK